MSLQSRREYLNTMRERYLAAQSRPEKASVIDEVVRVLGYHRKYAIHLLNHPIIRSPVKRTRRRPRRYQEALPVIRLVWEALDYPCAERLHPVLLETAEMLAQHGHFSLSPLVRAQLSQISRATLSRRLTEWRHEKPKITPTHSRTRPSLRTDIPMQRYDWDEQRPGALEIDLVEHNGGSTSGHYAYTLSVVDIVTGYSRRMAFLGRSQSVVFAALQRLIAQWPMKPWGLHADNGSEFLNAHLTRFCRQQGLTFTRSRPYRKNDNAHVEQKNRQFVREVVGYARYETPEDVAWLNAVYACLDDYVNLFLPMRKVVAKERHGGKLRKRYDTARTPFQRLVELQALDEATLARMQRLRQSLNPLDLHRQLEKLLQLGPQGYRAERSEQTG